MHAIERIRFARTIVSLAKQILATPDGSAYFRIPRDFKDYPYPKYPDLAVGFVWLPLSRISATGTPSDIGDHVRRMIKVLKNGKRVPPIAVHIRGGKLEVVDGNTRVLALKTMKARGYVPAIVYADSPNQFKSFESF